MSLSQKELNALARSIQGAQSFRNSLLLLSVVTFLCVIYFWAYVTEIDDVTKADGRVVPSGDIQVIEAVEDGVLDTLYVSEGEIVERDQLLMELNGTLLSSRFDQEQQRAYGLMARIKRLEAEVSGSGLVFDEALILQASAVVKSETALFQGRRDLLNSRIVIFENERIQRQQELEEAQITVETARATLETVNDELKLIQPLVERGIEPQTTLIGLKRTELDWSGRFVKAQATLKRLGAALDEIDKKIEAELLKYRSEALTDLAIATSELSALQPSLPALQQRASRAKITSPVRGVVNRLHRTTIGSMARSGQELIEIVPLDDSLLIEAYINPEDISFIYPNQKVKVKITAYDFARYGSLNGEVIRIGSSTIKRSERDDRDVFVAEIRTQSSLLDSNGEPVQIMPGMVAQVDILTGKKTILDYLIRPVIKVKHEAFRE